MAKKKTKPIVAVVGRPNVGKSTLFNVLAGERIAIVKDTPGITRDRIYADVNWLDRTFTLIDTGGIEPDSNDIILSQMREQAQIAIDTADVIMFMVDVKQGLVDADAKVADMLRRSHKPVVLVVNKVDNFDKLMPDVYEFYNLGIGEPYPISSVNRLGLGDMLDAVLEHFMIVRTVSAVERADVVVLLIDAVEGVTEQDAKIAGIAHERGKAMIIAVNKWDAVEKNNKTVNEFSAKVRQTLSFMPYAEILFISAQTGQRLPKLFDLIEAVSENHAMRVQTGVLNEIMSEAVAMQQPPTDKGKRLRLYYITQVAVKPPTFVIFVNDKELMHFSYTRYIENQIREAFGFQGTPLKFIIRERKENE